MCSTSGHKMVDWCCTKSEECVQVNEPTNNTKSMFVRGLSSQWDNYDESIPLWNNLSNTQWTPILINKQNKQKTKTTRTRRQRNRSPERATMKTNDRLGSVSARGNKSQTCLQPWIQISKVPFSQARLQQQCHLNASVLCVCVCWCLHVAKLIYSNHSGGCSTFLVFEFLNAMIYEDRVTFTAGPCHSDCVRLIGLCVNMCKLTTTTIQFVSFLTGWMPGPGMVEQALFECMNMQGKCTQIKVHDRDLNAIDTLLNVTNSQTSVSKWACINMDPHGSIHAH